MNNILTYERILRDRDSFRKIDYESNGFNAFDIPGHKFFKIFFYFDNKDADYGMTGNDNNSGGLLAPTWLYNVDEKDLYKHNSAWSYLKMNAEDERAEQLKQFVSLLSNISEKSPWYFSELSGLDAALERKTVNDREMKFDEQRQAITIKCLPDSFDDRIGTLLDLYRSITWSWVNKREVLPANLRKFDMGIFIFESPVVPYTHRYNEDGPNYSIISLDESSTDHKASYKYIEFHNCEIDYSSSKGNMSSLSNAEGFIPEYVINIWFDDCYESRYNEFQLREFGDFVLADLNTNIKSSADDNNYASGNQSGYIQEFENMLGYAKSNHVIQKDRLFDLPKEYDSSISNQITHMIINPLESLGKKAVLGNLYSFSLTRVIDQAQSILDGNIGTAISATREYTRDAVQRMNHKSLSEYRVRKITPTVKVLGKLFKANTIANNT